MYIYHPLEEERKARKKKERKKIKTDLLSWLFVSLLFHFLGANDAT